MIAAYTTQRRQYFRLPYPHGSRPPFKLINSGQRYRVLEVAEKSLLLEQSLTRPLVVGTPLSGDIVFHDRRAETISGSVFRCDIRGVVVLLSHGISLQQIIREQLYIKSRFPLFLHHH